MILAHVNKFYLESNLMAASPSSHLDSLYADLQMHALSVSDGPLTTVWLSHLEMFTRFRSSVTRYISLALKVAKKFRGNKPLRGKLQTTQGMPEFKCLPTFLRGPKSYILPPKTRAAGKYPKPTYLLPLLS